MYSKDVAKAEQHSSTKTEKQQQGEPDIYTYKSQLNNLIIENSNYRKQLKFFKEEVNSYKLIIANLQNIAKENEQAQIQLFFQKKNGELDELIKELHQSLAESKKEFNTVSEIFDDKYGENGEITQFESQLFILSNMFEAREREILYLENYFNTISVNKAIPFEYYDIDNKTISKTFDMNLGELRGSYASLSKQIINIKSKNEKCLSSIKEMQREIEKIMTEAKEKTNRGNNTLIDTNDNTPPNKITVSLNKGKGVPLKYNVNGKKKEAKDPKQKKKEELEKTFLKAQAKIDRCKEELKKNYVIIEEMEVEDKTYTKNIGIIEKELIKLNDQMTEKLSRLYSLEIEIDRLKMQSDSSPKIDDDF